MTQINFADLRASMLENQLKPRGIIDPLVLEAMGTIPREAFLPESLKPRAYEDNPLPIAGGQTISQPYIVALEIQAAKLDENSKVLEIGTGSGYAAAVAANIASDVYTIERIAELSEQASEVYRKLGYDNLYTIIGDGSLGLKDKAPFDAIIVTAAAPEVPKSLVEQLKIGGRLIIPVGTDYSQSLLRITKLTDGNIQKETIEFVRFVPLIGREGWHSSEDESGDV